MSNSIQVSGQYAKSLFLSIIKSDTFKAGPFLTIRLDKEKSGIQGENIVIYFWALMAFCFIIKSIKVQPASTFQLEFCIHGPLNLPIPSFFISFFTKVIGLTGDEKIFISGNSILIKRDIFITPEIQVNVISVKINDGIEIIWE